MAIALDRYIETSPDMRGGRPRIADTRLTVADVVCMYLRLGQSLEEIAGKYDLPLAAVYAAMANVNAFAEIADPAAWERAMRSACATE